MSTINIRDMDYETFVVMSSFAEDRVKKEAEGFLNELYSDLTQSNALGNASIQNIPAGATVNQAVGSSIVTQNITSNPNIPSSSVNSIFNKSIVIRNFRQLITVVQERERTVRQLVSNPIFRYPYILVIYNDDGTIRTVTGYTSMSAVSSASRSRLTEGVHNGLFEPKQVLPSGFIGANNNILKFNFKAADFVQSDPANSKYVMNKLTDLIGIYYFGTIDSQYDLASFDDINSIGNDTMTIQMRQNNLIQYEKKKLAATKANIEIAEQKLLEINTKLSGINRSPRKQRKRSKNKSELKRLQKDQIILEKKLLKLKGSHNKSVAVLASDPLGRLFGLNLDMYHIPQPKLKRPTPPPRPNTLPTLPNISIQLPSNSTP